jgi:hypothetical protein
MDTIVVMPPRQEKNITRDVIEIVVVDSESESESSTPVPRPDNYSIGEAWESSPHDSGVFDNGPNISPSPTPFSVISRDSTPTTSFPAALPFNLTRTDERGPLVTLTLCQLTGMFLLARQRGRETEYRQNWTIRPSPDQTPNLYIALFDGQIVQGLRFVLWHETENHTRDQTKPKGMKACAFGCRRSGNRLWASSQKYSPL